MIAIRPALPSDADAIAAIEARSGGHWSAAMLLETLGQPSTRAFVASDPEVVGHVIATAVASTGEIVLLAVAPERRRQGLAHRLLERVEATWRAEGVEEGWLEVRADNEAAIPLYASRGWTPAGARRRYYRDGTDAHMMQWRAR